MFRRVARLPLWDALRTQNYEAFLKDPVDWQGILATYIGIFIFAGVWIGYRLVLGGRFVPYAEMRFPEAEKFEKEAGKR